MLYLRYEFAPDNLNVHFAFTTGSVWKLYAIYRIFSFPILLCEVRKRVLHRLSKGLVSSTWSHSLCCSDQLSGHFDHSDMRHGDSLCIVIITRIMNLFLRILLLHILCTSSSYLHLQTLLHFYVFPSLWNVSLVSLSFLCSFSLRWSMKAFITLFSLLFFGLIEIAISPPHGFIFIIMSPPRAAISFAFAGWS